VINLPQKPSTVPPHVEWQTMVGRCFSRIGRLRPREQQLIQTLLGWRGQPTERQMKWLTDIYLRVATSC
jgi:hypothetical protein